MQEIIQAICRKEGLQPRQIQRLHGGQVNHVFQLDNAYILRIGAREGAFLRLQRETELMRRLPRAIPIPEIYAFGEQDDYVYQVQQFMPGKKLYAEWMHLRPAVQEDIAAQLAHCLKILHSQTAPSFGYFFEDNPPSLDWAEYLSGKFRRTLADIETHRFQMVPGFVELAVRFLDEHLHRLQEALPVVVHGDLSMVNILVNDGKLSALLDFEYAMQAPKDYELWVIENFCLYPNDYAEEERADFCAADFANFLPLLRKHYPELFEVAHLRERVNVYQVEAALSSYIAWRKANLATIPAEQMAAKEFYLARISNFIFRHGIRLF